MRTQGLLTGLCLLLAPMALPAQLSVPAEVLQREEAGDLAAARDLLLPLVQEKDPSRTTEAGLHLNRLQDTLRSLHLASIYRRDGDEERAKTVLENLLTKLDPVRDGDLIVATARALREIQAQALVEEREAAQERLNAAKELLKAGKHDEAIATYDEVAKLPASQVPRSILREARLGKIQAVKAKAQSPTFWREIGQSGRTGARTVTQWLVYLASAGLLGLLFSGLRSWIPARPGTVVQLQDLTAPASEQEARSQHLVREFLQKVSAAGHPGDSRGEEFEEFEGRALGHLRIEVDPLAELQTFMNEEAAVQIGPFSLNPRQLLRQLGTLFQKPPESILRGSLTSENGQVALNVEHRVAGGKHLRPGCWEVAEKGEGARSRAIQRMALRIAFELAGSKVTSDWESFDLYRQAMDLLTREHPDESREQELARARDLLRRSLVHDPANWLARFHLATLERTIGDDEMAAEHFEFLDRMLAEQSRAGSISSFLRRHPEFVYTVRYNWAVSLAKQERPEPRQKGLELLDELTGATAPPPATAPAPAGAASPPRPAGHHHGRAPLPALPAESPARLKIEMLARSARAAALSDELERAKPEEKDLLFQGVKREKDWFAALRLDHHNLDWKTYALGCAVALNAFGRACLRLGFHNRAVEAFRETMIVAPDYVDAYNNLAAVYLDQRRRQDPEWARRLEDLLGQALRIQGSSQKAHLLLGRYYSLPAIGRYEEARQHLEKASLLSWSYYYLAEILIRQDRKREEALTILRRSIFMDKWPDRRYVSFIECALDLSQRRGGDRALLKEALQLAEKYAASGQAEKAREKSFRQSLLAKVQAALTAASGAPDGKPAQPPQESEGKTGEEAPG